MRASHVMACLLLVALLIFGFSAVSAWQADLGWHDQQRTCQLLLLSVVAVWVFFYGCTNLPAAAFGILVAIFAIGLVSSLAAEWPWWAIKEWGRYVGLLLLVLAVGALSRRNLVRLLLLGLIAFIGFIHSFQFTIYYFSAFLSGVNMLDADLLFPGFSNPRFFGQFQIMLMPILALLILGFWQNAKIWFAAILLLILAVQWCIALTLGGRGLWFGLAVSNVALLCISCSFWRLFVVQLVAALAGSALFVLLFHLLPGWLDLSPTLRDSLRTSLSGRGPLWQWAWDMAVANPWLGVGPMHYAATFNPIAAHPHQVILQWAAEWGFMATLLAMILAGWGILHGAIYLHRSGARQYDAALWLAIVGALVLAQVDGVFVMPYTETWLAIFIGLALAQWSAPKSQHSSQRYMTSLFTIPVIIVCAQVLLTEVPSLAEESQAHRQDHNSGYTPRFWQQGWIPMVDDN